MRTHSTVAVAVAAVIGTNAAFAVTNPAYTLSLNIAGSSALSDAVIAEFKNVLCGSNFAGPFVSTQGTSTAMGGLKPDFRALTCTLGPAAGTTLSGTVVAVYYRSEGGSIVGLLTNPLLASAATPPLPLGVSINRLNIGVAGGAQPFDFNVFETVPHLLADTQTGAVVMDFVDLAVTDAEPTAFIGENSGSEFTFFTARSGLPFPSVSPFDCPPFTPNCFSPAIGEVYAPIVSNLAGGGTAGFANASGLSTSGLTSQELATIFAGGATDWSTVPSAAAVGGSGPITLCRRASGSGAQTVTSAHFLNTNCGTGLKFATATSPGLTVITNYTTSQELACVHSNPGSIGFVAVQPPANYTGAAATQVAIDGTMGTAATAAQGKYTYYGEAYFIKSNVIASGSLKGQLINKLVTSLELSSNAPSSSLVPNLVAMPEFNVPFSPVIPLHAGQKIPIAIGTTGGQVCLPAIDQL